MAGRALVPGFRLLVPVLREDETGRKDAEEEEAEEEAEEEEEDDEEEEEEGDGEEEEEEAVVGHLDGRDFLTEDQLLSMGFEPRMRKGARIFMSASQLRRDEAAWRAREEMRRKEMTVKMQCIMSWDKGERERKEGEGDEEEARLDDDEEGGVLRMLGLETEC
jgi:hypothetical protein